MNTSKTLTKEDKKIRDAAVARLTETHLLVWRSKLDAATCPECTCQDGRLFSTTQIANMRHVQPPLHKGCRCSLVPYKEFP